MMSGFQLGASYEKICPYRAHYLYPNLVGHVPFYSDCCFLQRSYY